MDYEITKWNISKLHSLYEDGKLLLNPPYQRNYIWSINDQKTLIDSIQKNQPIPNFFLLETDNGKFEVVDGQQRTRTIIGYMRKIFSNSKGEKFDELDSVRFLNYEFPVTILTNLEEDESIELFYAKVNGTGIHLNRPELKTAKHYDTLFLKLINELASSKEILNLDLFTDSALKRMNDIDFVSELVNLIINGITEKKIKVDELFEEDISKSDYQNVKTEALRVFRLIEGLNKVKAIKSTRYKQRNDFYTLFNFIHFNPDLNLELLEYFYKSLIYFSTDIKPSQEQCEPFQNYARNCVTQSNSKSAREERLEFFNNMFLNNKVFPNKVQEAILSFYEFKISDLRTIQGYLVIQLDSLARKNPAIEFSI